MSNAQCIAVLHTMFANNKCARERETIAWAIAKLMKREVVA